MVVENGTKPGASRVTIKEVAKAAGVSVSAVSKVLREARGVSPDMKERVNGAIKHLGFRPFASARGMRGRTFTIGLVLPEIRSPFFSLLLDGVHLALSRTKYQVLLGVSRNSGAPDSELIDAMIDRQMDGLILAGAVGDEERLLNIAGQVPLVIVGHHAPAAAQFDTVNNDDELGARLATRNLIENGYRNIAMVSLATAASTIASKREGGYRAEMEVSALGVRIVRGAVNQRETRLALLELLSGPERPEAIFCWQDSVAIDAIGLAHEMGLRVPQDLALVGYDDTSYGAAPQNNLTSVDQSGELLGMQAARFLLERVEGRIVPKHFVVTPRVVQRESSRKRT